MDVGVSHFLWVQAESVSLSQERLAGLSSVDIRHLVEAHYVHGLISEWVEDRLRGLGSSNMRVVPPLVDEGGGWSDALRVYDKIEVRCLVAPCRRVVPRAHDLVGVEEIGELGDLARFEFL